MRVSIPRWSFLLMTVAVLLPLSVPAAAAAQDEEEANPADRVIAVTHMKIPFTDRGIVFPFMRRYFLPQGQLNPNVLSQRVMWHYYGRDAQDVMILTEYASLEAVEAPCGAPCEEYDEANAPPEEGEEGYEEYEEAQQLFAKYFARHSDEVFFSPGDLSKIEGTLHGPVGLPEDEEGME